MIEVITPSSPHGFAANTYILRSGNETCVIDPTVPYDPTLIGGRLKYIILTHCHFDHILELDSWAENTSAEVIISADDAEGLSDPSINCYLLFSGLNKGYRGRYKAVYDGDKLSLGEHTLSIVHLPGHTPGCIALVGEGLAFVGDTVFAGGGFGRCDLPRGNYRALRDSIMKVLSFPDDTVLYCGHGESTTVKEYKKHSIIK